ncbi:helix-turn-helix domain-containing protein [Yinghuangia sp. YIM S09857]|uniref:helix-turn-helix domain-containing protein n=1 Tax=Yinghuangia sp. YIM S09857 TaxID=3436929 RepID=UPI003F53D99F
MPSPRTHDRDWTATSERAVIGVEGAGVRWARGQSPAEDPWLGVWTYAAWDFAPADRRRTVVLGYPVPHLVVFRGQITVCGVSTLRHTNELRGTGSVLAVELRPGAMAALFGERDAAALVDRTVPVAHWTGDRDAADLSDRLTGQTVPADMAALLAGRLAEYRREREPVWARDVLEAVLVPGRYRQVREAANRNDLSIRSLQRLFHTYVGTGPKAAMRRCRILAAAAALVRAPDPWTRVASQFGYFDQPHFINDFSRGLGITPAAFAAECRRARSAGDAELRRARPRGRPPGPRREAG